MEELGFGDNKEAVDFIIKKMKKDKFEPIPEPKIIDYILDKIFDFYEFKGYFDENIEEDDPNLEFETMELVVYIQDKIKEDNSDIRVDEDLINVIIDYNFEYEDSLFK